MPVAAETADIPVLNLRRVFKAPRERVFRAWTDPERLAKWWGPESRSCPFVQLELRRGGRWRTCMKAEDGEEVWVQGEYKEVDPPKKLVFTWAWETNGVPGHETEVSIEFVDLGSETEMLFRHQGFETTGQAQLHNQGWDSSFVCFDRYLKSKE